MTPRRANPPVRPQRADGVDLIGEYRNSGYKAAPWLVRRADGETVQLTHLLFVVLAAMDGRHDLEEIGAVASSALGGRRASREAIAFLIDKRLRPLGLVKRPDGANPRTRKAEPMLTIRPRIVLAGARATRVLTAPFSILFAWPIVTAVVVGFAAMTGWLLFVHGLGPSVRDVIYRPQLLLITAGLAAASAGFHEFGHAAACRYSGARPGAMGAGLYLVWPVFYTDVTDSYRLGRAGRLRVDLGGVYFNAIFALGTFGAWAIFGWEAALVVVPLQFFQILRQLQPFVRLDGYHILADLTGVPDLFARIKPTLLSVLPKYRRDERVTALKPWVRVTVAAWTLFIVPALMFPMAMLALGLPRMLATAWDSLGRQWQVVTAAFDEGELTIGLAATLSVLALLLPATGALCSLYRFSRRSIRGMWRRTVGRPLLRGLGLSSLAAVVIGLGALWWPDGQYRSIQADENWTVPELMTELPAAITNLPDTITDLPDTISGRTDTPDVPPQTGRSTATPTDRGAVAPAPPPVAPAPARPVPAAPGSAGSSPIPTVSPTGAPLGTALPPATAPDLAATTTPTTAGAIGTDTAVPATTTPEAGTSASEPTTQTTAAPPPPDPVVTQAPPAPEPVTTAPPADATSDTAPPPPPSPPPQETAP